MEAKREKDKDMTDSGEGMQVFLIRELGNKTVLIKGSMRSVIVSMLGWRQKLSLSCSTATAPPILLKKTL